MSQKLAKEEVNVQVVVRCRPQNQKEKHAPSCIQCLPSKKEILVAQKLVSGKEITKTFSFDSVYGSRVGQSQIFRNTVQPIIEEVLEGYNCTIFAYGQTSSGKTYSMEGARDSKTNLIIPEKAGIIPRSIRYIFQKLDDNKTEYTLKVSCLELYNEELQDLLSADELTTGINAQINTTFGVASDKKKKKLRIFDDAKKGTIVAGLEEVTVRDADHVMDLLDTAATKRSIAETQMNALSSRSHVITTITIHIREIKSDGEEIIKTGKLNLVDLAGSENIGRSGAVSKRAKEAGRINQSLLTLGRVITALTEGCPHVPYRESKLTRLLQDALGGRSKTCILATISPSALNLEETLSTLDYAHTAKSIKNKPELNAKCSKLFLMKEMSGDLEKLKQELRAQREKNGVYLPVEQHEKMVSDAEKSRRRIDELNADIEQLTVERDDTKECLEQEQEAHKLTQQTLSSTSTQLKETTSQLENTTRNLQQTKYILAATQRTELTLSAQAEDLRLQLRQSIEEADGLRQRVTRHEGLEYKNSEVVHVFHKKVHEAHSTLEEQGNKFSKAYSQLMKDFKNQAHSQWQESYNSIALSLKQKTKDAHLCHKRQVESISQLVESFSNDNLSAISNHQKQLKKQVQGLREDAESSFAQLEKELLEHLHRIEDQLKDSMAPLITQYVDTTQNMMDSFVHQQQKYTNDLEAKLRKELLQQSQTSMEQKEKLAQLESNQATIRAEMRRELIGQLDRMLSQQESALKEQSSAISEQLTQQSQNMKELQESSSQVLCEAQIRTETLQDSLNVEGKKTKDGFKSQEQTIFNNLEETRAQMEATKSLVQMHHKKSETLTSEHAQRVSQLCANQKDQWKQFVDDYSERKIDFATQMDIIQEDQEKQFETMQEEFVEGHVLDGVNKHTKESKRQLKVYNDERSQSLRTLSKDAKSFISSYKESYESTGETPQKLQHNIPESFAQTEPQRVLLSKFVEKENLSPGVGADNGDLMQDAGATPRIKNRTSDESDTMSKDAQSASDNAAEPLKQRNANVPILLSPPRIKHGKGRKRTNKSGTRRKRTETSGITSPRNDRKRRKVMRENDPNQVMMR